MKLLNGTVLSQQIRKQLKAKNSGQRRKPGLAILLIGNNPASHTYVRLKEQGAKDVGILFQKYVLPEITTESRIRLIISRLNQNPHIHGVLVQLPLPKHLNADHIVSMIDPRKDVDGFHPVNMQRLLAGKPSIIPGVFLGILRLIGESGVSPKGKRAVVLANSRLFAEPLAALLNRKGWKVSFAIARDGGYQKATRQAHLIVSAMGKPHAIKGSMIKRGAILVDVGFTKRGKRLFGDVDLASVKSKAGYVTPVPGGVGPMTVAMLLWNTWRLSKRQK